MKLNKNIIDYVQGERFSDSFNFSIEKDINIPGRMEYVEKIVQGKKVLHIGCLDNLPLIERKIEEGSWFHERLTNVASECIGIDIDQKGIDYVSSKLGISNIYYGNLDKDGKIDTISSQHWDYVIFGEMIEHLDNPVSFLQQFIDYYQNSFEQIIITVPNCYKLENIWGMLQNTETINSDHRYWFSPYTLCKVVYQAGLNVAQLQMCKYIVLDELREKLKDIFRNKYPIMADTIVVICHKQSSLVEKSNYQY